MLPKPPQIVLESLEKSIAPKEGFLQVETDKLVFKYPDGTSSNAIPVDRIIRKGHDAVVVIAHHKRDGEHYLYLRSCIRPAISLRDYAPSGIPEESEAGNLWELPAGLIEASELALNGVQNAGARELREEVGFTVEPEKLSHLGHRVFSAVGFAGERLFFVHTEVDPTTREEPSEDGSPFEKCGVVLEVKLFDALKAIYKGEITDSKTIIGLYRLLDELYGEISG